MATRPGAGFRRRQLWLRVSILAIVGVLVAEVSVRGLESALPTPDEWPDLAVATKAAQLDQLRAEGCTDVVFVGTSMTRDDLDPGEFTAADPTSRSSYNAALDAASPVLLERWMLDHVLPATSPATVVIGVASFDLNDAASTPAAALRSYANAPRTAQGSFAAVERFFLRRSALVRNRSALRDPVVVAGAVRDRLAGRPAPRPDANGIDGVIASDGHGLSRRTLSFDERSSDIERLRDQFLEPFDPGGHQAAALRRLVDAIEQRGARVAVLVLPVTDSYVAAHPDGATDVARFDRLLTDTLRGSAAAVVTSPDQPVDAFADSHHLNAIGASSLSRALPGLLDDARIPARRCGPG